MRRGLRRVVQTKASGGGGGSERTDGAEIITHEIAHVVCLATVLVDFVAGIAVKARRRA